jgi:hypothetical protein
VGDVVDHDALPSHPLEVAVVVGAEKAPVVDAGGAAGAVFGQVVALGLEWRGVAAGEGAAFVAGDQL